MTQQKNPKQAQDHSVLVEEKEMPDMNGEEKLMTTGEAREDSLVTVEEAIARAEKAVEIYSRISQISLKMTKPADWVLQDGTPYLMESGAQKIANLWGIDISGKETSEEWQEDPKGKYYIFIVKGMAYSKKLNRVIEDEGTCSQRDKFFGMVGKELKPLESVDKTMIRKKAQTNLNNRLIKKMAGISGITIEDLKEAGIDVSKIPSFEYKKGVKKAEATLPQEAVKKRDEIWKMLIEMTAGNEEDAKGALKKYSAFTAKDGKEVWAETVEGMRNEKWIAIVHKRVKTDYEAAFGGAG